MSDLLVLVLDDPHKCDEVIRAWLDQGVTGVTILNSAGLVYHSKQHRELRDDLPLFPGLDSILRGSEEPHRTILAVLPDGFDMDALAAATEEITGVLDEPETGIMFVVPIKRVWGLRSKQP